ncbi:calcium-binding protein [Paraconexibacter sp.]|uniref:calcium-binding protein n=1 Tax=Paraconexibacter sp. TaxID=2949640 RepID=UPI0035657A4B
MLRSTVTTGLIAAAVLACAGEASAAFTVSRSGPQDGETLSIRGTNGEDALQVTIASRAAAVDSEEVVTIEGADGSTTGPRCTSTTDNKGFTTAVCTIVRGGTVVIATAGGDDRVLLKGSTDGVQVPPGRRAVIVDLDRGDDRLSSSLTGSPAADGTPLIRVLGDVGSDVLSAGPAAHELDGGADKDILDGDRGNDVLLGGPGEDTLRGGPGQDLLDGGSAGDRLDGGPDFDTVAYGGTRAAGVEVTLDGRCNDGGAEDTRAAAPVNVAPSGGCAPNGVDRDLVENVEAVIGTSRADTLIGGNGDELLSGGGGDDTVEGGIGVDTLIGGDGVDLLLARDEVADARVACGSGAPPFVTQPPPTPGDRAVLDQFDPTGPDCTSIERGGQGVTGPADERPVPQAPPADRPADPPPPAAPPSSFTSLNGGNELGALPGGGAAGKPPEIKVISRRATPDRRGRVALRIACVYQARACVSRLTLTAPRTLRAGKGRRAVRIRKGAVLGSAGATIPWGRSAAVRVTLTTTARKLIARTRRPTSLRLKVVARDGGQPADAKAVTRTATVEVGRGER